MRLTYGTIELGITLEGTNTDGGPWLFAEERDEPVLGDAGYFRYFGVYFRRRERFMLVYPPVDLPPPKLE